MKKVLLLVAVAAACVLAQSAFYVPVSAGEKVEKFYEKKVTIDQVPRRVKRAILKAVGDGRLVDISEITQGNKKTYEIEMIVDGKEWDVVFDAKGKELKRTFEGLKPEKVEKKTATAKKKKKTATTKKKMKKKEYQKFFDIENRKFTSKGKNRFFILMPGYRLVLEGKEGRHTVKMEIVVTDRTKKIGDVETRVVEERESVDGKLVEISKNFFAMCKDTKSVFYFGEEVDIYKDGKVAGHEGAWIAGENGAKAGMMMPGEAMLGARYYQEVAPKIAMDRAEIVDLNTTLTTPAGKFRRCLKSQEENPLDGEQEFKIHAPGIGLVQDENLLLTKCGYEKE
ncbi:MAG: hypothetical protein E3J72_08790 [Planctomycetota bacterium]|nr:MAG: hypothetical protein E3J72_08790 [Planctomycetota bacterium]